MILPGTGRGTSRRLVEGAIGASRPLYHFAETSAPSTTSLRDAVPLPVPGRM
jgi:hypothetical protein